MITKLILLSISIFLVSKLMDGIKLKSFMTAIIVAVVYSVVDLVLWWVLVLFSMPLIIITFGLFVFVLNTFLLWLTDQMIEDFEIKDLKTTFFASLIISAINLVLSLVF